MTSFKNRVIRAARLDAAVYEEVEADKGAMQQALSVVLLSSLAAGIGTFSTGGLAGIAGGLFASLIGWFLWALLTYLIGAKLFPQVQTRADMGEMLRTIGFSSSPGLIRIFGIIPGLTGLVFLVASVWMFVAMVVGVRQALDYTTTLRAVGVCLLGWLIQALLVGTFLYFASGPQDW